MEVAAAVDNVNSTEEKIKAYCSTRLDLAKKKKTSFDTINMNAAQGELSNFKQVVENSRESFKEQEHNAFKKIIMNDIENKEVQRMNDEDIDLVVFVTMNSFREMKQELIKKNDVHLDHKAMVNMARMIGPAL